MKQVNLLVLAALICGCDSMEVMKSVDQDSPGNIDRKAFQMAEDKLIFVTETHPVGQSLSELIVESQGFNVELSDTIKHSDPVSEIFLADLDSNGFDEIYIVTQSAGSGSYGRITAYASNKDKSLTSVYVINQDKAPHADYSGHDTYVLKGGYLLRYFKTYGNSADHFIRYTLIAGEASWLLSEVAE